jgi:ribosomal protein L11 methyltransferase
MSYLAYKFVVSPPLPGSEILIALIADFGFDAFDYNDSGFTAYIKEENEWNVNFDELIFDDFTYTYQIEKIPLINWNEQWEKNFDPVFVEDNLVIRAPFHPHNKSIKHEIVIMPKMSFGTGHHQTTRLMCRKMFLLDFGKKRVLDMGCGTAVLAILARLLGANDLLGIDIDAWSVENSIENCLVNHCSDIKILLGDVQLLNDQQPFDFVLANINKNILKADMPAYSKKLKPNGLLLISGFFTTDADELKARALENNLKFLSMTQEDEWAMMTFAKNLKG